MPGPVNIAMLVHRGYGALPHSCCGRCSKPENSGTPAAFRPVDHPYRCWTASTKQQRVQLLWPWSSRRGEIAAASLGTGKWPPL
eukprot:7382758-Prymnesium_polylepis.1